MAKAEDHLDLANRTLESLGCLIRGGSRHSIWVTTLAFYRALHVVQVALRLEGDGHCTNHDERHRVLKTHRKYNEIFKHYKQLHDMSLVARYLQDRGNSGYSTFDDYLPPAQVLATVVHHLLARVEKSALKFIERKNSSLAKQLLPCAGLPRSYGMGDEDAKGDAEAMAGDETRGDGEGVGEGAGGEQSA